MKRCTMGNCIISPWYTYLPIFIKMQTTVLSLFVYLICEIDL